MTTLLKPRILAIEDNQDFLLIFRHLIEAMGYEMTTSSNAQEGLEISRCTRPDIVFCDLGLPGAMDGFGFAKAIRADAGLANIPLIAVTARTDEESKARAIDCGFDRIFPKPVKFSDIRAAIAEFSNGRF